jgi:hypothetical protein
MSLRRHLAQPPSLGGSSDLSPNTAGRPLQMSASSSNMMRWPVTSAAALTVPSVAAALRAALAVAVELRVLHSCGLVHKALHPCSILLHPPTGRVQMLDLSAASLLVKDRAEADSSSALSSVQCWLYCAPEQSGKANRVIDARSDLYALGAILFELLMGRPPFVSNDALEIIHMHLARAPPSILPRQHPLSSSSSASSSSSSTPLLLPLLKATQAVLHKLLQKQAEDRYQSAAGLAFDLRFILAQLPQELSVPSSPPFSTPIPAVLTPPPPARGSVVASVASLSCFEAGQLDLVSTWRLSQKLYGRTDAIDALRKVYARITASEQQLLPHQPADAGPQLFLLQGVSGSGKSSLVDELQLHILAQRGLFVRAKFDLVSRNDSSCVLGAFRNLVLHLLVRDAAVWKVKLLRALGANAQVLSDVLPELGRLLGRQPPVPTLATSETANRFAMVLGQFICCVASANSPLCFHLDDTQWSDRQTTMLDLTQLRLSAKFQLRCSWSSTPDFRFRSSFCLSLGPMVMPSQCFV